MDQREVLAAWEKFVERGALSSDLRSSVASSWQRSKNHRVTIDRARAPLVADAELFRRRSKHASLRHAARCALENSKTFLGDANSIMILTDPTGLIIDTQGDDRVIDAGRTVHLEHGGRWSEADIGTNAIGAAIAESKLVQIVDADIFDSEVRRGPCLAFRFTILPMASCSAWWTSRARQAPSIRRASLWPSLSVIMWKACWRNRSDEITQS